MAFDVAVHASRVTEWQCYSSSMVLALLLHFSLQMKKGHLRFEQFISLRSALPPLSPPKSQVT